MNLSRLKYFFFLGILLTANVVAIAQETCPSFVFEMLETISTACDDLSRNQVCYGNENLITEFWDEETADVFIEPSDIVNVIELKSIGGSVLDLGDEEWGMALMSILANIPNTVPGQSVQFLLVGDIAAESAVSPDEVVEVEYIDVTTNAGANLRTGPSTNFGVGGSVGNGETLSAIGQNTAGDWIQVLFDDTQRLWIADFLVNADGDLSTLPDVTTQSVFGPMQSFFFNGGIGDLACDGAPPDHILVNSPEGIEVNFTVNGVNFTVGSRGAIWFSDEDVMTITTFDGSILIDALGTGAVVPPGFEVDVQIEASEEGNPQPALTPQNYRPYDPEIWKWYENQEGDGSGLSDLVNFNLPPVPVILEQSADNPLAPEGVQLGSGDVQVTLTWDSLADMDLAVFAPTGEYIFYGDRSSASGGQLDVDSNFPCGTNTFQIENIFWPDSGAPVGNYSVEVNQFSNCASANANWTMTVRLNGQIVQQQSGTGGSATYNFTYNG